MKPITGADDILALFDSVVVAISSSLETLTTWELTGTRDTQYTHDVSADEAALNVLADADVTILSEETGLHNPGRDLAIVIDPVDGSTNASMHLPWYATSLCAVRDGDVVAAMVVNLPVGTTFRAVRGAGATVDHQPMSASGCTALARSIIGINGYPPAAPGTEQFRALGATALDMAYVAAGRLDGYVDFTDNQLAPWDYLGALLLCQEAGAVCADVFDRDLVVVDHEARRTPLAAATPELFDLLLARRLGDANS